MNKILLLMTFILISYLGLCQDINFWKKYIQDSTIEFKWAREINRFISPRYVLLNSTYSFYNEVILNGQKAIITIVSDTMKNELNSYTNKKIFVFLEKNGKLKIIDSSSQFETGTKGPVISIKSDSLLINNSDKRETSHLIYKWNRDNRYTLVLMNLSSSSPIEPYNLTYDVNNELLSKYVFEHKVDEGKKQSIRKKQSDKLIIHKKLSSNISLNLNDFKDPLCDDNLFSFLYD